MSTIDQNLTLYWYPLGTDMLNSSGFQYSPSIVENVYFNQHLLIVEQILAGILLILMIQLGLWLYFKFTRDLMRND